MRNRLVSAVAICGTLIASACAPVKSAYYLPVDEKFAREDRHCGVSGGGYRNNITDSVGISISGTLNEGDLWLNFQFVIDEGHSLRFTSNSIVLTTRGGEARSAVISESSGHEYPSLDPTQLMVRTSPGPAIANVVIADFDPEVFTLRLPTIQADGVEFQLSPIVFAKQKKQGFLYCIQ